VPTKAARGAGGAATDVTRVDDALHIPSNVHAVTGVFNNVLYTPMGAYPTQPLGWKVALILIFFVKRDRPSLRTTM